MLAKRLEQQAARRDAPTNDPLDVLATDATGPGFDDAEEAVHEAAELAELIRTVSVSFEASLVNRGELSQLTDPTVRNAVDTAIATTVVTQLRGHVGPAGTLFTRTGDALALCDGTGFMLNDTERVEVGVTDGVKARVLAALLTELGDPAAIQAETVLLAFRHPELAGPLAELLASDRQ